MRRTFVLALVLALAAAVSAGAGGGVRTVAAIDLGKIDPRLRAHVSGTAALELRGAPRAATVAPNANTFFPSSDDGCPASRGDNVKVNQNCLNVADADLEGRSQAQNETAIAIDPNRSDRVVASYNDYRRGDATCGSTFSRDGGRTWADSTVPNGFTRGDAVGAARQYWHASGDTSVAWDTRGNAYLSCQVFMRGAPPSNNPDASSGFVVFRSTGNGGASWNFPGRFVTFANDVAGSGAVLEDKQYIAVDDGARSPFRDRVYVTWTEFTATSAFIYEASSSDFGETFGPRHLVSTASALCRFPTNPGGGCDNNQGSQPFTAPDGTLYVVWSNFNTVDFTAAQPGPAEFQVLIAASHDGGATFGPPQRVASYFELPDCATYQDGQGAGSGCVPEKGPSASSIFRAANYASGAVNPANPRQVVVSLGSYIGPNSNESNGCVRTGLVGANGLYDGVKTPGACKNDVLVSVSNDGGATFDGTTTDPRRLTTAAPGRRQATSDQWFQWLAFRPDGQLAIAYYDRQFGSDETTGFSDYSLAGSRDARGFAVRRVTSGSSPPPTQFGGTFWGDYAALAAHDQALPLWSDTRAPNLFLCPGTSTGPGNPPRLCGRQDANGPANDEDVFVAGVGVPD